MNGNYNPRYYTLDLLSAASLWLINDRLKKFLRDLNIKDYPIDCFRLIDRINESGIIHITLEFTERLSSGFRGAATFFPNEGIYWIVLPGKGKPSFRYSKNRQANFSLAHELAHILLEHLGYGKKYKSSDLTKREDLEADEFAGRLLMPENLILKSNYTSEGDVSSEYFVSDQALFKRLNNLKRLDLLHGMVTSHTCRKCGNHDISPIADYCMICGTLLSHNTRKGVRMVEYPAYITDSKQRVILCIVCGNEEISDYAGFCRICGAPLSNICGNDEFYGCNHVNASNARYCELCGSKTEFHMRDLFTDWLIERDEFIKAMTHR